MPAYRLRDNRDTGHKVQIFPTTYVLITTAGLQVTPFEFNVLRMRKPKVPWQTHSTACLMMGEAASIECSVMEMSQVSTSYTAVCTSQCKHH